MADKKSLTSLISGLIVLILLVWQIGQSFFPQTIELTLAPNGLTMADSQSRHWSLGANPPAPQTLLYHQPTKPLGEIFTSDDLNTIGLGGGLVVTQTSDFLWRLQVDSSKIWIIEKTPKNWSWPHDLPMSQSSSFWIVFPGSYPPENQVTPPQKAIFYLGKKPTKRWIEWTEKQSVPLVSVERQIIWHWKEDRWQINY